MSWRLVGSDELVSFEVGHRVPSVHDEKQFVNPFDVRYDRSALRSDLEGLTHPIRNARSAAACLRGQALTAVADFTTCLVSDALACIRWFLFSAFALVALVLGVLELAMRVDEVRGGRNLVLGVTASYVLGTLVLVRLRRLAPSSSIRQTDALPGP